MKKTPPPSGGHRVLVVSGGHHSTAGELVLCVVYRLCEGRVPLPAIVLDHPLLQDSPQGDVDGGLVEEDDHANEALQCEKK